MKVPILLIIALFISYGCSRDQKIDRYSLVNRHNVEIRKIDSLNTLTVGNGAFAFSVDITGLQTFPEYYAKGIPLGTMSEWGWHYETNKGSYDIRDVYKSYNVHGRDIEYVHRYSDVRDSLRRSASEYLRRNPYRVHLGVIGLDLEEFTGSQPGVIINKEQLPNGNDSNLGVIPKKELSPNENDSNLEMKLIQNPHQKLDLWKGEIISQFSINDTSVSVITVCHPGNDMVSVRIVSDLTASKRLRAKIHFPDGTDSPSGFGLNYPPAHKTSLFSHDSTKLVLKREMEDDSYFVTVYKGLSDLVQDNENRWFLSAHKGDTVIEFSCLFSKEPPQVSNTSFSDTRSRNQSAWENFWTTGGAVDFSGSTDPRASELERRVVLSRYLTKIQCAGYLPPAETGLTFNSWYGKFHLEMHWWHAVHFALWQNEDVLIRQMEYYNSIFDKALTTARKQGYAGVRWPKMTDPAGNESPSGVGTYLIWQQPHFIYFAELLYQNSKDKEALLEKYSRLVFSTADFMASYAWFDTTARRYILGPVLISAQESLKLETTVNPTFELVYWYWGLKTAAKWQKRMGLDDAGFKDVAENLSPLPVDKGVYLCSENSTDTWQNERLMSDHPIISGIRGMLPETPLVDDRILGNSLDTIQKKWNWRSCWGWDFPMLAMSAASIGRTGQAIDFLMMEAPKNRYLENGHNYQDARLSIYLPGNGGLLSAVAMMCTSDKFPKNGQWKVRWENLNPSPR